MPVTKLRPSFVFTQERLEQLKQVVPEAFADGKVNWEVLREAMGEHLEDEGPAAEHFGLFWPGKRDARRLAAVPSKGTLVPVAGDGVNERATHNTFIEGDNLEVLKLLQKSYAGRVKMIYIDPPFNTGNDFVYSDDFAEPLDAYLKRIGQLGDEGEMLTTNTRSGGRYHSNWLSMMMPRLLACRQLMSDDGVIFVSIDDHEAQSLKAIMNEIFGEEAFIGQVVWKSRRSEDTRATTGLSTDHEYVLCYGRSDNAVLRGAEKDLDKFSNPDNDPRGEWRSADLTGLATRERRPNLHFDLVDPATGISYGCPPKGWRFERSTMAKKVTEGRVLFPADGSGRPRHKLFLNEMRSLYKNVSSVILDVSTADGTREIHELLGPEVFPFPKPTSLISRLIEQVAGKGDLVMDFFAGSCTTGNAVWELGRKGAEMPSFMLVQLPEPTERGSTAQNAGFENVAEIGKERLRRAIKAIRGDKKHSGDAKSRLDLGFRVFRLAPSHFKTWKDYSGSDLDELQLGFEGGQVPLVEDWTEASLMAEILLLEGFPLDSFLAREGGFTENRVIRVETEACTHRLYVCLDNELSEKTTGELVVGPEDVFVCMDAALSNQSKVRLSDACRLHVI
jgi:adenine-specific DNA-methyltransferase